MFFKPDQSHKHGQKDPSGVQRLEYEMLVLAKSGMVDSDVLVQWDSSCLALAGSQQSQLTLTPARRALQTVGPGKSFGISRIQPNLAILCRIVF
jgi:hypothetical protein